MLKQKALLVQNQNKYIFFYLFLFLMNTLSFGQNSILAKMYFVKWDSRYTLPRTIENIKETKLFYFESSDLDLEDLFSDYRDCIVKLKPKDNIIDSMNKISNVCVELCFKRKVVRLFFKNSGEYYFEGKWYRMNSELYFKLFNCLSNELIPIQTLEKAKMNRISK